MDANNNLPLFNRDIINAVRFLYGTGRIKKDKDIVDAMESKKNTVSTILSGKANAGPDFRTKFEEVFKLQLSDFNTPFVFDKEEDSIVNEHSPEYLAGKLIGKLEIKDEVIAQIEARRKDIEAFAEKMEAHYSDMKNALERAQKTIIEILNPMKEQTQEILSNSKEVKQDTSLGLSYQRAWVEYTAEEAAQGDKKKKDQKVLHMNKLLRSQIDGGRKEGKSSGAHKQHKEE